MFDLYLWSDKAQGAEKDIEDTETFEKRSVSFESSLGLVTAAKCSRVCTPIEIHAVTSV